MPIKVILSFDDENGGISADDIREAIETHGIGFSVSDAMDCSLPEIVRIEQEDY